VPLPFMIGWMPKRSYTAPCSLRRWMAC